MFQNFTHKLALFPHPVILFPIDLYSGRLSAGAIGLGSKILRLKKVIEASEAVALVKDGDTLATTGYGGNGTPDELFCALEKLTH